MLLELSGCVGASVHQPRLSGCSGPPVQSVHGCYMGEMVVWVHECINPDCLGALVYHLITVHGCCVGKTGGGGGMGGMHQYISPDCLGMWFTLSG